MFSQELINRAEAIVFGTYRPIIVGLAYDSGEVSEEDWEMYLEYFYSDKGGKNISLTFAMFVLAIEELL